MSRERRYYVYMTKCLASRALHGLEEFEDVRNAIDREKEIKGWTRAKKEALITSVNPHWIDLSKDWKDRFKPEPKTKGPSGESTPSG